MMNMPQFSGSKLCSALSQPPNTTDYGDWFGVYLFEHFRHAALLCFVADGMISSVEMNPFIVDVYIYSNVEYTCTYLRMDVMRCLKGRGARIFEAKGKAALGRVNTFMEFLMLKENT